jgi:hypothetical protein
MLDYELVGRPRVDSEARRIARDLGLHAVAVTCDDPGAKVDQAVGVSFVAFCAFTPRVGEHLKLEDSTWCRVVRVSHFVSALGASSGKSLTPNVYAVRDDPEGT